MHLKINQYSNRIGRITETLCFRSADSNLDRPEPSSEEAHFYVDVLSSHWKARGVEANVIVKDDRTLRAQWTIASPPLVSIIIPTKDKLDLIKMTVDGLIEKTAYKNIEIIIVDTMSVQQETFDYYDSLRDSGIVRIVDFHKNFNYSEACNLGAASANGELLLFLNNDIEVINNDWLDELVRYASIPGVGLVGRCLFIHRRTSTCGVVVGMHVCGLIFRGANLSEWECSGRRQLPELHGDNGSMSAHTPKRV